MARPCKCRRVCCLPQATYFKPAGIPLLALDEVCLTIEEAEALRLKDITGLNQEESALCMNISRPTFQRILACARKKTADALLNGKAIRIEGGNYMYSRVKTEGVSINKINKEKIMNIAIVTDDEVTISRHFGRAHLYAVVTVENGKVTGKEIRPKAGHHTFAGGDGHDCHDGPHGVDEASQQKHVGMMANIMDCQTLIAGGMGYGAYESLKASNIEPVITDEDNIDTAARLYVQGKLANLMEKLH
jgi:predicted DNA-binding protein (UPF0251 family)/predicted Fe-Mo cluster-binding NifX family protein